MDLVDGEEILWQGRPSWRAMLAFYIRWIAIALVVGIAWQVLSNETSTDLLARYVWLAVLGVLGLTLLVGWIRRVSTRYTVTNRRIYVRSGLLARRLHSTAHDRIQNVNTSQTVAQRVLGVGNVDFDTAGGDDFEFVFAGVTDPHRIAQQVASWEDEHRYEQPAAHARPGGV